MGLDWTLRNKIIAGREGEYAQYLTLEAKHRALYHETWKAFLVTSGEEEPHIYPNPVSDAFEDTVECKDLRKAAQALELLSEHCTVSPMATLRAPRVGIDVEATAYAEKIYSTLGRKGKEKFPTVLDYLTENHGCYVAELAQVKEGLGSITGIFVGAESFRGKIVGMTDWVDEDLKSQAYEDKEPAALIVYGKELLKAAAAKKHAIKQGLGEKTEYAEEEVKDISAAGDWCIFWGEQGHAMSPWY